MTGGSGADVLVVGESLVDLVLSPSGEVTAVPGGGPFTTARAVARQGVASRYLGTLSDDRFGRLMRERLVADGVDVSKAPEVPLPTTLAMAELDDGGSATYRFYVEGTSAPALTPTAALAALADPPAVVHVGTLGLVLEPMADAVADLVAALPATALLVVDPNYRPAAVTDPARYRERLGRVLRRADVVKVSDEDLDHLQPGTAPVVTARALLADGPSVVLLTHGSRPVLVLTHGGESAVPVPAVEVVDTVGAGDTFAGVFVAGLVASRLDRSHLTLDRVLPLVRRAAAAAALACTVAGAAPPTAAEVDAHTGG